MFIFWLQKNKQRVCLYNGSSIDIVFPLITIEKTNKDSQNFFYLFMFFIFRVIR